MRDARAIAVRFEEKKIIIIQRCYQIGLDRRAQIYMSVTNSPKCSEHSKDTRILLGMTSASASGIERKTEGEEKKNDTLGLIWLEQGIPYRWNVVADIKGPSRRTNRSDSRTTFDFS